MGGSSNIPNLDDPDLLAQLMGGRIPGAPQPVTPPYPMSLARGTNVPPTGPAPAPPANGGPGTAPVAKVSDDPSVTGLPPVPTPPKLAGPNMANVQALADQIKAKSQPIQRSDYKPSVWQRILAPVVAGVQGFGDADKGIKAGNELLSRNYDRAVASQKSQLDPLYAQMDAQSKMLPFYKQGNETAQSQFEDQGQQYDRGLKTVEADNTVRQRAPQVNYDADGTPHFMYSTLGGRQYEGVAPAGWENAQTKKTEDKNTPAVGARPEKYIDPETHKTALRIQTKAGGYMPYTPKTIDEGALTGDPTATALFNRAHPGKEGEKKANTAQSRLIAAKKDSSLKDAEDEYATTIKGLDDLQKTQKLRGKGTVDDSQDRAEALATLNKKKQRAQDNYEEAIAATGGEPTHLDVTKGGSPAAGSKTVAKSVVQQYADSHKMDYAVALKGFQSKGYSVQ